MNSHDTFSRLSDERLLTRAEVEKFFGYPSKRFLEIAALRGDGPPFIRIGRSVRYRVGDLRQWLNSRTVTSTSQVL
jgi:predicted DNA-binding transcriptional regulator AlpA